jgi:ELWxxDGT repeat protein
MESDPFGGNIVALGNQVLFFAYDPAVGGGYLWSTDGTTANTAPIAGTPTGGDLVADGSFALFASGAGDLWRTDGTSAGTTIVTVNGANQFGLDPRSLALIGGVVYFNGADTSGRNGMWVTDGTTAGTHELTIAGASSAGGIDPNDFVGFNGDIYFFGIDAGNQRGLWQYDPTTGAAAELTIAGANASLGIYPSLLTVFGNALYFKGYTTGGTFTLWKSDGTGAGTHPITAPNESANGFNPTQIVVANGLLYFSGVDASGHDDLWSYDGNPGDSPQIVTLGSPTNSGTGVAPDFLTAADLPCFLAGTMIRTPRGEVRVEALAVGDSVLTLSGAVRPIVWIGHGRKRVERGRRCAATPIIVRKGALANNVPHRDLRITKGHALFLDGVLVPAEFLVNHRSILWDDHAQTVSFFHVELDAHDVLIADGAPAESYRDDGNRWLFGNASTGWGMPPKPACAPVLTGGERVDALWRRLLDRSGARPKQPVTGDPDLHVVVDGARIDGINGADDCWLFRLPAAAREVRIVSHAAVPAEIGLARDFRPLGVALRQVALRWGDAGRVCRADDPELACGFHAFEPDNGFRWTDGDARLPDGLLEGIDAPCLLELAVAQTTTYPLIAAA